MRKTNVSKLLDESLETYYWIGFLYADGCIGKRNLLDITSAAKDKEHLEKFSKYINKSMNLLEKGLSVAEISRQLNMKYMTVTSLIKRLPKKVTVLS